MDHENNEVVYTCQSVHTAMLPFIDTTVLSGNENPSDKPMNTDGLEMDSEVGQLELEEEEEEEEGSEPQFTVSTPQLLGGERIVNRKKIQ